MRSFFNKSLIQIEKETYLTILIIIAPLLNFLSGITIDLYTPSLPAIAHYYDASITAAKNTLTATVFGFAIGSAIFGTAIDIFGRRRTILFAIMLYILASFLAIFCTTIAQLMFVRFIQGLVVASVSIGAPALIVDNYTGHRYNIGILYTSMAYSLGPIIGPFIGGFLQYHFGWQANFLAYALFAICLFITFALFINESEHFQRQSLSLRTTLKNYITVLKNRTILGSIIIGSGGQFELMVYPTVGPFIVEEILHHSAITFGNTALLVSCGYFLGTLANRALIKKISNEYLILLSLLFLALGTLLQICFAVMGKLNLVTLLLPIALIGFSNGFKFNNLLSRCLRLFPQNAGITTSVFICFLTAISALGIFIISHIDIRDLTPLASIFAVSVIVQLVIFFTTIIKQEHTVS